VVLVVPEDRQAVADIKSFGLGGMNTPLKVFAFAAGYNGIDFEGFSYAIFLHLSSLLRTSSNTLKFLPDYSWHSHANSVHIRSMANNAKVGHGNREVLLQGCQFGTKFPFSSRSIGI
jgi:hypothetical protein